MVEPKEVEDLAFEWGKRRGIGGKKKDVQFYESFSFDGMEYTLYDCVYLYKDGVPEPYIGKLIKIWEHSDKAKRVKVLWFFRPYEILKYLEGVEKPLENELFLASGEGLGLSNVNPLEAIAGKCNVVCISKDIRNPQPSDEEIQRADFVFYRTFDVGKCKVMDKIDEKIAGIEVKFLFNRVDSRNSVGFLKVDSNNKEVCGNDVENLSSKPPKSNEYGEHKNLTTNNSINNFPRQNEHANDSLSKLKSSLGEKHVSSMRGEMGGLFNIDDSQENISNSKTISKSKLEEKKDLEVSLVKHIEVHGENPLSKAGLNSYGVGKVSERQEMVLGDEKAKETEDTKVLMAKGELSAQQNILDNKIGSRSKAEFDGRQSKIGKARTSVEASEKMKSTKDPSELDNRLLKKAKLEGPVKVLDHKRKNIVQNLGNGSEIKGGKVVVPNVVPRDKAKLAKDPHETLKGPSKKPKLDDDIAMLGNNKLLKASLRQPPNEESKIVKVSEGNRRPNVDRSKWFIGLPWEERMQTADEQGTLVLLQNLDSTYTSDEVEEIVWCGFNETCTAKMIQQTLVSNPHYGQALVIFRTREAAEKVVTKLHEGCLLLSNGRPLLGSIAQPCFPKKQSTYFGHLVLDKFKHQMQREMKGAVSTSHCSQPNTLEYDMAMEWCLLQERLDRSWEKLFKQQMEESRKLRINLKSE